MRQKILLIFLQLTIIFGCSGILKAQDFLPFVNDNYSGITGANLQPASIADSRYKVDVTLMGLSLSTYNNYLYIDRDYLHEIKNFGTEGYDIRKNLLRCHTGNGDDKFLFQDLRLDIMNIMVTINPRFAIGFSASFREVLNIDNISEPFADLIYFGETDDILYGHSLQGSHLRADASAWAEYGLTFAGVLYKSDKHLVKAGMNVKLLEGLGSVYANINELNYEIYSGDSIGIYNTHVNYGLSENIGNSLTDGFQLDDISGKFGMGFDFGVIWEWRPNYDEHLYDMDGETNLERREDNKYKLRVGLSVKDLGAIKYKKWQYSQDFNINGSFSTAIFDNVENLEDFNTMLESNPDIFTIANDEEVYRMSLPTAISLQVDYNIYKDFYVNLTPYIALKQGNSNYSKVHSYNLISLTPRYETAWFGASLPIQYNQLCGFSVGTGLRLGPVWVGSNNMLSTLFKKEAQNLNIQMLVKVPIPHTRVKDTDGDGVSDKIDECKDVYGILKNMGCPEDDRDEDGVPDDVDRCPDDAGKAELNGCPDKDNDGIADIDDTCPDVAGLAIFDGCPDSDNDSIPDHLDKCPTVAGLMEYEGCPDSDGDGIPDHLDKCPNIAGLAELEGCPRADSDNDGIADIDDDCPEIAGPAEFNGCPDSDGDGIRDIEDECPSIAGLAIFNGCPDTDNDSIPDHLDNCPMIKGLAQFNGCPDTDADGVQDSEDECPNIAGLPEFNGCPDTDGDGIQDSEDECPEEPGTAENKGCPVYEKVEFATNIGFESGKAKLTQDSYPYLDQLVQLMNDNPDCWVKLDGHTDSTGSDAINNKLSQERVDAIKNYLIDKGINPNRIVARGHGSSKPIATNDTAEGRAKNRRVEINLAH